MAKSTQFIIAVENRPGTVAEIAHALGDAKVNILALSGLAHGAGGTVHVIVDNARRAKTALDAARCHYTQAPVNQVELPNKPGALAKYLDGVAKKGVNLNAVYATTSKNAKKATVVFVEEKTAAATS
ncbi:MAG TPA: ACT domain-containing protein [Terriglobales bacterium]|nr:ACT domain-containing protein [Terriglobales bacterium]